MRDREWMDRDCMTYRLGEHPTAHRTTVQWWLGGRAGCMIFFPAAYAVHKATGQREVLYDDLGDNGPLPL